MQLVIVESPTKARKLAGYLGKDFMIEASVGHIRDLPKSGLGVNIEKDFEPEYEVSQDKLDIVHKLQKLAKKAQHIYLATDPDREGEAIAWHLQTILNSKSGKNSDFLRATFHEITKPAVLAAIENPGKINSDLVDAQQARRVVDRLVGYKLSPVLWRKVRRGLSAGRVQSVALRMIVEREREIEAFKPEEYWELDVALSTQDSNTKAQFFVDGKPIEPLPEDIIVSRVFEVSKKSYKPTSAGDVKPVAAFLTAANTIYQISALEKKQRRRSSLPPFTTSTLQQAAANKLGMTSKQTMRLAQQLYEEGLITYHRTDSVALSKQSIEMARAYIAGTFGQKYLPEKARFFANSSKNAQEAHEAIRVTDVALSSSQVRQAGKNMTERHAKLYDLIWRRFLASQMETAVYDQTTIEVEATGSKEAITQAKLRTTGSVLTFDGWMKLFTASNDTILPPVEQGQTLNYRDILTAQKFTLPPPRYNDASLVKELEKRGIGRPSTYASIISVLEDRGYVERLDRRFMATAVGITVSDFLLKHFSEIMDYDFTAEMEEDLDRIARGEKEWKKIVKQFFSPLSKQIESVIETAKRVQVPVEKTGESCPKCKEGEVVIRTGKYGKFKSCSRFPDCDYSENIVEKVAGVHCPLCHKGSVITRKTRWGKEFYGCDSYPECNWAAWKKPKPGESITQAEWDELQKAREERKKQRETTRNGKPAQKSRSTTKKKTAPRRSKKTARAS